MRHAATMLELCGELGDEAGGQVRTGSELGCLKGEGLAGPVEEHVPRRSGKSGRGLEHADRGAGGHGR